MRNLKSLIFISLFIGQVVFLYQTTFSQTSQTFDYKFDRINVKSPIAAGIELYGKIPVSTATGVPNISIPIENIKLDNNVSIPIQLNYHASGLKVDDISGIVGLKWSLFAGGSVERDINGMPDEEYYFQNYNNMDSLIQIMREETTEAGQIRLRDLSRNLIDINQDSYSYNFLGSSDNLVYKDGQFIPELNYKKHKVERVSNQSFKITDDNGSKYYFDAAGDFTQSQYVTFPAFFDADNYSPPYTNTSWKLSRIETVNGKVATFEYLPSLVVLSNGGSTMVSERYTYLTYPPAENSCPPQTGLSSSYVSRSFHVRLLSKIKTADKTIEFTYDEANTQLFKITIKDKSGSILKEVHLSYSKFLQDKPFVKLDKLKMSSADAKDSLVYKFDYNSISSTFSTLSRDMFGFYNAAPNNRMISTTDPNYVYSSADRTPNINGAANGMLSKFTYPTGGYTEFEYELNQVSNYYAPGIRIKKSKDYTSLYALATETQYEYIGLMGGITFPYEAQAILKGGSSNGCSWVTLTSELPSDGVMFKGFGYSKVLIKQKSPSGDLIHEDNYDFYVNNDKYLYPLKTLERQYMDGDFSKPVKSHATTYIKAEHTRFSIQKFYSGGAFTELVGAGEMICSTFYAGLGPLGEWMPSTIYKTGQIDTVFNGSNLLISKVDYKYEDTLHTYATAIESSKSDGSILLQRVQYPLTYRNISGTDDLSKGIKNLVDKHILTPTIENAYFIKRTPADSSFLNASFYNYHPEKPVVNTIFSKSGQTTFQPSKVVGGVVSKDPNYELRMVQDAFDRYNNPLQIHKNNDVNTSYIWDYDSTNVVAEVINASHTDIAYTSFEAEGGGNWAISGTVIDHDGITGYKSFNGTCTKTVSAGNYTVTLWRKVGSTATVNGLSGTLKATRGNWQLLEWQLSSVGSIAVQGSQYDELRLHPRAAMMTTYTYLPLVGVSSKGDINNNISYFTYDGLGRLVLIRDMDKNVLKKFCYNYSGQVEDCNINTTATWIATGTLRCQPCSYNSNYTTNIQERQERDDNPNSATYGSYRWVVDGVASNCTSPADWQNTATAIRCRTVNGVNTGEQEQEQKDMNPCSSTGNQTRWVVVGTNTTACPIPYVCTTSNCYGNDKKCINGVCETGTWAISSSVYKKVLVDGYSVYRWVCTWRYCFSDGTQSTYSQETYQTTSCAINCLIPL